MHGQLPCRAAVLHGGPGAPGSAGGLAAALADFCGILEPWQSEGSIAELIEELKAQIAAHAPLILIGHSWGAWLGALFAARYPEMVSKLILVSSGALEEQYVAQMTENRLKRFSEDEKAMWFAALKNLDNPECKDKNMHLERLGALCDQADSFAETQEAPGERCVTGGEMYKTIWSEAAALRKSGALMDAFREIKCSVTVFHGKHDTTPADAITEPLSRNHIRYEAHLLDRCGHTPWREKYAREPFLALLKHELIIP